ncbi:hypothetical protein QQF64_024437 [Cirrhinus molitorella]|uniref:Uncharacterized protein n=1 Tax=Cirrhinus molitorella TaxID=172907 RepID=A0ABR3NLE8_9TELE
MKDGFSLSSVSLRIIIGRYVNLDLREVVTELFEAVILINAGKGSVCRTYISWVLFSQRPVMKTIRKLLHIARNRDKGKERVMSCFRRQK